MPKLPAPPPSYHSYDEADKSGDKDRVIFLPVPTIRDPPSTFAGLDSSSSTTSTNSSAAHSPFAHATMIQTATMLCDLAVRGLPPPFDHHNDGSSTGIGTLATAAAAYPAGAGTSPSADRVGTLALGDEFASPSLVSPLGPDESRPTTTANLGGPSTPTPTPTPTPTSTAPTSTPTAPTATAAPATGVRSGLTAVQVRAYKFYRRGEPFRFGLVLLIQLLSFFEEPEWYFDDPSALREIPASEVLIMSGMPTMPRGWALAVHATLLATLFVFHLVTRSRFLGTQRVLRDSWNRAQLATYVLMALDMGISALGARRRWRIAPLLRPVLFGLITHRVRGTIVNLFSPQGLISLVQLLLLSFAVILLFAWAGFLLFSGVYSALVPPAAVFNTFETMQGAILSLWVMMTAANTPDVTVPAVASSRWANLYFIAFAVVAKMFLFALFFSIVYDNFKSKMKRDAMAFRDNRRESLLAAFRELDRHGSGVLHWSTIRDLIHSINANVHMRRVSIPELRRMAAVLDSDHDGIITRDEFLELTTVLATEYKPWTKRPHVIEKRFPALWESASMRWIVRMVKHPRFEIAIDALIIANAVILMWETLEVVGSGEKSRRAVFRAFEWIFTLTFTAEMLAKLFALDFPEYWHTYSNRFDMGITISSIVTLAITSASGSDSGSSIVRTILLLRVARVLRIVLNVPVRKLRMLLLTALSVLPIFATVFGMLYTLIAVFAHVGILAFGGDIRVGDPKLDASLFGLSGYAPYNFNDLVAGMTLLWNVSLGNNWMVVADGIARATGTSSGFAWFYFLLFYIVVTLMAMNLVSSFVLDAFLYQAGKDFGGGGGGGGDAAKEGGGATGQSRADGDLASSSFAAPAGQLSTLDVAVRNENKLRRGASRLYEPFE
jgi:hypothetical protein